MFWRCRLGIGRSWGVCSGRCWLGPTGRRCERRLGRWARTRTRCGTGGTGSPSRGVRCGAVRRAGTAKPQISAATVEAIVADTLHRVPGDGSAGQSARSMAARHEVGETPWRASSGGRGACGRDASRLQTVERSRLRGQTGRRGEPVSKLSRTHRDIQFRRRGLVPGHRPHLAVAADAPKPGSHDLNDGEQSGM